MAKKRVSLTLSERLVDRIDGLADSEGMNRSRTMEEILEDYFSTNEISTAVIFCGDPEVKSLDEYEGEAVIKHIIVQLVRQGVKQIYLLTGGNEGKIKSLLGENYSGTSLHYISEDDPKGNAAALRTLSESINEPFAALNGHVITDVDLQDMYNLHKNTDSAATIALTAVQDPSNYGAARLKGDKILGFEEKPEKGKEPSKLINAGTYIFQPSIFEKLDSDSIETVFESLAQQKELSGYIYGGKWQDVSR